MTGRNAVFRSYCFAAALAVLTAGVSLAAQPQGEESRIVIEKAALDYIEGWFEANAERMDRALHPDLVKRTLQANPATGQPSLQTLNKSQMVEYTRNGGGKGVPAERRGIKVTVLDVFRDIATVRVESVSFIDYLQLARSGDRWQIVNVLWTRNLKDRQVAAVDPKVFTAFVGEYELKPQFVVAITADGGHIYAQATGQPKVEIFPESELEYFLTVTDAQITFVKDGDGRVQQLVLHQGGRDITARRVR
jgi:hypothetical protein